MSSLRRMRCLTALLLAVLAIGLASLAQDGPASELASASAPRALLIDETRTFASTMRVGALAGALRQAGVDLDVRLETVASSFADPLAGLANSADAFDLILVVPAGIEDGSVDDVWLLRKSTIPDTPDVQSRIEPLRHLLAAVFEGIASPTGVRDDLWLDALAASYEMRGWLR